MKNRFRNKMPSHEEYKEIVEVLHPAPYYLDRPAKLNYYYSCPPPGYCED